MGALVIFTAWPLCPWGNSPLYPLSRKLGGSHKRSGHFGEKNISCFYRESNNDFSVIQTIAGSDLLQFDRHGRR